MTTRYYEETPCPECGRYHQESLLRKGADPESSIAYCYVGGQRRELRMSALTKAIDEAAADAGVTWNPNMGPIMRRAAELAIIPLEEPADG